jgi:hypothetical protein
MPHSYQANYYNCYINLESFIECGSEEWVSIRKREGLPTSRDSESQWLSSVYLLVCECLSASEEGLQQIAQVGDCIFSSLQLHASDVHVGLITDS